MNEKEKRYAIVLPAEKPAVLLHCWPEDGLELKDLQDIVEGHIETVETMLAPGWAQEKDVTPVLIINEEGKLRGLPYNEDATMMAQIPIDDEIVGNAVLMLARGEELIGFRERAARNIIRNWCVSETEWAEAPGEEDVGHD